MASVLSPAGVQTETVTGIVHTHGVAQCPFKLVRPPSTNASVCASADEEDEDTALVCAADLVLDPRDPGPCKPVAAPAATTERREDHCSSCCRPPFDRRQVDRDDDDDDDVVVDDDDDDDDDDVDDNDDDDAWI